MTTQDLWRLLVESKLLTDEKCQKFAQQYAGVTSSTNAEQLGAWLIDQKVITRFHAKILLTGRPGPFSYGEYKLYDRVSQGRMSGLFKAVHSRTGHRVALQFLSGEAVQSEASLARVRQSAATAVSVKSPYIQRCYEFVDLPDYKFFVLEDLSGETAQQKLANGRVDPVVAAGLARDVALGLGALHQRQLVHGDIRPDQFLITKNGHAKLLYIPVAIDPASGPIRRSAWGDPKILAQVADYVSPEVVESKPADSRSDVYSLGAVLYHLSAGQPPFPENDLKGKLQAHSTTEPAPAHQVCADVPEAIGLIAGYMLIKAPDSRYQSAAEVAEALAPYLDPKKLDELPHTSAAATLPAYEKWLSSRKAPAATTQPKAAAPKPASPIPLAPQPIPAASAPAAAAPAPVAGGPVAAAPAASAGSSPTVPAVVNPAVSQMSTSGKTPSLAQRRSQSKGRDTNKILMIVGSALAGCLLIALLVYSVSGPRGSADVAQSNGEGPDTEAPTQSGTSGTIKPTNSGGGSSNTGETNTVAANLETITGIDGPMWLPPTSGTPLELNYFPRGVQMFVALRPADLMKHPEGPKLIDTLGGLGQLLQGDLAKLCGQPLEKLDQVVVGLLANSPGKPPRVALVARTTEPFDHAQWVSAVGSPAKAMVDGKPFYISDDWGYYAPEDAGNQLIVVAPAVPNESLAETKAPIVEALDFASTPAPLGRLATLVKSTDASRHCTVLYTPSFLFTDGKAMFSGEAAALKGPLDLILHDEVGGIFSAHLDGNDLFLEAAVMGKADKAPSLLAADLRDVVQGLAGKTEDALAELPNISSYSRKPLLRYPRMLAGLQRQITAGHTDKAAVLMAYLPAVAAHNLAFDTRLGADRKWGVGTFVASAAPKEPETAEEKLDQVVSLSFVRDTLETSIALLAKETNLEMEIMGGDLQLEGITKNQSFGLDERDKSARAILKTIMAKANPDGKLVYIIKQEGDTEKLYVTTRAAVKKRGDTLPPGFEARAKRPGKTTLLASAAAGLRNVIVSSPPAALLGSLFRLPTSISLVYLDTPAAPAQAQDKLDKVVSLSFVRNTLEFSLRELSKQIGLEIEFLGSDLQLEGITKNQSFGLDERNKPARAILQVILNKANPDGKLVYIIKQEGNTEKLYITTRAAVKKRGDTLPTQPSKTSITPASKSPKPEGSETATKKLNRAVSVSFPRNTFEAAIAILAKETSLDMELLGADLLLEGITKNQSFGLDEQDKPARAILQVILNKANPDGKLVYIIKQEGNTEKLYITTRAAVTKRGDTLPPELAEGSK